MTLTYPQNSNQSVQIYSILINVNLANVMYASSPCVLIDPTWFLNFGPSHHVTSNPSNLTFKQEFDDNQQFIVRSGDALQIENLGMNTFSNKKS